MVLLWLLVGLAASSVRASETSDWLRLGEASHQWLIEDQEIIGTAQQSFLTSFLLSNAPAPEMPTDFHFAVHLTRLSGVDHNLVWNFLDTANYYQVHFNGQKAWLTRFRDGQQVVSVGVDFFLLAGPTYALEITQHDHWLTIGANGAVVMSVEDETFDERSRGTVGFKLAPGLVSPVKSRFTNWELPNVTTSLAEPVSLVPLLKQTDPAWSDLVYDSASTWSDQPTIGRWGCALTSFVMIMQAYGFDTMPDGQPVTPVTVNAWLSEQPDGFVGQGLVNWWAGTRLVALLSEQYSTPDQPLPKLEFRLQAAPWQEAAEAHLAVDQPFIAQVPGHFVVAHSMEADTGEFLIHDPLADWTHLSDYPTVHSLRLFQPSQTDLSALVIGHPATVEVVVLNEAGEVVSVSWQESLDSGDSEVTDIWSFTAVFQPPDGRFTIHLTGEGREQATVFAYDSQAQVTSYQPPDLSLVAEETTAFEVAFSKAPHQTVFFHTFSWEILLAWLEYAAQESLISSPVSERLIQLARTATSAEPTTWPRYKNFALQILEFSVEAIEPSAAVSLRALLE